MKISNSKKELARIISENGGWCDAAQFYVSTCNGIVIGSKSKPKYTSKYGWVAPGGFIDDMIEMSSYLKNWHQTILSREEYFHLYPAPDADGWIEWGGGECPVEIGSIVDVKHRDGDIGTRCHAGMSSSEHDSEGNATAEDWSHLGEGGDIIAYRMHKPEIAPAAREPKPAPAPEAKPTIEQLAADYRNAKDFADRKRQEADAAKVDAEAKLAELVSTGKALGLVLSVATPESELVITDWRDLKVGDELTALRVANVDDAEGKRCVVVKTLDNANGVFVLAKFDNGETWWVREWRFIRRP